jgi:beta-lactamase superfamily II metal-dependent hydrolase
MSLRAPLVVVVGLVFAAVFGLPIVAQKAATLDIYSIDVEGGGATLFVSSAGESLLIDAGNPGPRDSGRIAAVAKLAGLRRIDYFLASHYHGDHVGGVAELAAQIPIAHFVDHGPEMHDEGRFRGSDAMFNSYLAARAKGSAIVVKPGERHRIAGTDVQIVSSDGQLITKPLTGGGQPNPLCGEFKPQEVDVSENARSVGAVVRFGRFSMLALGDLTWNKEHGLVCPNNLLGNIDVYLTTHHGLGLSGPKVLVHAIRPRVAVMNNGPRKGAARQAWTTVKSAPGLEDLWQLHYSVERPPTAVLGETEGSGGPALNVAEPFIANLEEAAAHEPAHFLKLTAREDGGFTVENSRNGHRKTYAPRK